MKIKKLPTAKPPKSAKLSPASAARIRKKTAAIMGAGAGTAY